MKKIEVLGPGCAKCVKLAENVEDAAKSLGIEYEIEKVTDMGRILSYGVMSTPALIVDGKLVSFGRMLNTAEIQKLLQ